MGFWDRFLGIDSRDPAQRVLPEPYEPYVSTGGIPVADPGTPLPLLNKAAIDTFWREQPNLRKVVDFIARSVASVPFHTYERLSDDDRQRVRDHDLARMIANPRPGVSQYRFWHAVHSDGLLYDKWCVVVDDEGHLLQVPSWRLKFKTDVFRRVVAIKMWVGDDQDRPRRGDDAWVDIDLDIALFDHGYDPHRAGLSPVHTLKSLLEESAEAIEYRRAIWENGGRIPAYVARPLEAPDWTPEQRTRFTNGLAQYRQRGAKAGGWPLMEDGMSIETTDAFKPQEAEDLEGRRLAAIECAAAYHIAPELVGARQGNYSNIKEYRQMLYRDSLGPYIMAPEQAINAQLTPRYAGDRELYVEAYVDAKLRGSFEEQAQMLSTAIGAPWMLRDEGRARLNMPKIPGGDQLVTPLNVLVGGQASPTDSGTQNQSSGGTPEAKALAALRGRPVPTKARAPQPFTDKHVEVLAAFFTRQGAEVRSALGAGDEDWWDSARWDRELTTDLLALSLATSTAVALAAIEAAGLDPEDFNADQTIAFLTAVAARVASSMNATTKDALDEALAEADDAEAADAAGGVFDEAVAVRAEQAAITTVTAASAFGVIEAAAQVGGDEPTKTWVTTSKNPRASHAAMNGQTVGIDEKFSNGADWPADGNLSVDEVAGCTCEVRVNF